MQKVTIKSQFERLAKSVSDCKEKYLSCNKDTDEYKLLSQLGQILRTAFFELYGYSKWQAEKLIEEEIIKGTIYKFHVLDSDKLEYITSINRSLVYFSFQVIEQFIRKKYKNDIKKMKYDGISNILCDIYKIYPKEIDVLRHMRNTTHAGFHTKPTTETYICKTGNYIFEKDQKVSYFRLTIILDLLDEIILHFSKSTL